MIRFEFNFLELIWQCNGYCFFKKIFLIAIYQNDPKTQNKI
jgi:hypothetical protein